MVSTFTSFPRSKPVTPLRADDGSYLAPVTPQRAQENLFLTSELTPSTSHREMPYEYEHDNIEKDFASEEQLGSPMHMPDYSAVYSPRYESTGHTLTPHETHVESWDRNQSYWNATETQALAGTTTRSSDQDEVRAYFDSLKLDEHDRGSDHPSERVSDHTPEASPEQQTMQLKDSIDELQEEQDLAFRQFPDPGEYDGHLHYGTPEQEAREQLHDDKEYTMPDQGFMHPDLQEPEMVATAMKADSDFDLDFLSPLSGVATPANSRDPRPESPGSRWERTTEVSGLDVLRGRGRARGKRF